MIVYKCDRCGKIVGQLNNIRQVSIIEPVERYDVNHTQEPSVDLCDDCINELRRFLMEFRESQKT